MKGYWVLFVLLCSVTVDAGIGYQVLVNEKGDALVVLTTDQENTIVTLPFDVEEVRVDGGLYIFEEGILEIETASGERAQAMYRTSRLTTKEEGEWVFRMSVDEEGPLQVYLPVEAIITGTEPDGRQRDSGFKIVEWNGEREVDIVYKFEETLPEEIVIADELDETIEDPSPSPDDPNNSPENIPFPRQPVEDANTTGRWWLAPVILATVIAAFMLRPSGKKHIIKTLPPNERKIVMILTKKKGEMKRNDLERALGLAKSSLASSLNNLEKKNIVEIDRKSNIHHIRFTKWYQKR